jgi:signal transduction histidine kinase
LRQWPPLVALAIVVLLSLTMLGVDLVVDRSTADTTNELVNNSMRSIALADDLRYQAYRLATANLTADQIDSISEQIDADARAYTPLATYVGESGELARLQGLLAHLRHEQPLATSGASATLIPQIETSIARLVEINQNEARHSAREIAEAHHSGLVADAIVGTITLVLAVLVAVALVRSLRRERRSIVDKRRELAAFAARTAHDLRGPLSPLRGYSDLLSLNPAPEVQEISKRLARGVERMTSVIDSLLAISVHGKPPPGKVGVAPVVLEVLDDLRDELTDAELAVNVGDLATACSAGVLAQLLRNVITNAAKYRAPERRLLLRVEAKVTGDRVAIAIVDNGIGMDENTVAHAFEPLYRAPGSSSPGHGLGLSIVKRTIDSLGGAVVISSMPGRGTTVTMHVPSA